MENYAIQSKWRDGVGIAPCNGEYRARRARRFPVGSLKPLAEPAVPWPDTLAYKALATDRNPVDLLATCRDLYEGPDRECVDRVGEDWFQERYLDRRQSDPQASRTNVKTNALYDTSKEDPAAHRPWVPTVTMGRAWETKKRICRYANRAAGMLDHVCASVLKFNPRIEGPGEYWTALNDDVDGNGTDFNAFLRTVVLETFLTARPFISIVTPPTDLEPGASEAEARAAGAKDLCLALIRRESVTDWTEESGALRMVRVFRRFDERSEPWGEVDKYRYLWTFFTANEFAEYELTWPKKDGAPPAETLVSRKRAERHDLDGLPLEPVTIMRGLHAMRRLKDPALALYNLDSAIRYSVWRCAFPVPYLKTSRGEVEGMQFGEEVMPKLDTNDELAWFAAPNTHFDAAFKERDQARRDLYEVFSSMAQHAAALAVQNPRQSAEAKGMDREPFALLLQTVADGLREAVQRVLRRIAVFREDDPAKVRVTGLDNFTGEDGDELQDGLEPKTDDPIGKVPLATQQLALASERFKAQGNTELGAALDAKASELVQKI